MAPKDAHAPTLPALLRFARATYAAAIRDVLAEQHMADVPRNGPVVLGALARGASPLGDIIKQIGVSKQAAGQLVDTLVARGYLDRQVDAEDRRRLTITLTTRGRAAARASQMAVEHVNKALLSRVSPQRIAQAREVLAAIAEIGRDRAEFRDGQTD